jgi:hypothetical protein
MNNKLALGLMLCAAFPYNALAQRIQNLSMSPQEMRTQNVQTQTAPQQQQHLPGNNLMPPGQTQNGYPVPIGPAAALAGQPVGATAGSYMEGYCDPNFKPILANNAKYARMASCLEEQKQQACGMYQVLPADAKRSLDFTLNCLGAQQNGGEMVEAADGTLQPAPVTGAARDCGAFDTQRLTLLKQYWQDANTAYALVFLPDLVMDSGGQCMGGR